MIIAIYVDDVLLASSDSEMLKKEKAQLSESLKWKIKEKFTTA